MIAILVWLGFAEYAGAHSLCHEHVAGTSMHVDWMSYATTDDPTKVIAFYEKSLGAKSAAGDNGSRTFDLDKAATTKLAVFPAAKADTFPHCSVSPKADDKTVILVSKAIK